MTATGQLLAPGYTVIEHLSRTRRLDTFEVWSDERACSCVAKALRPDRRDDGRARAALKREGRLLTELCHPHIVRGYELLSVGPIAIMETLDGETVAHLLDRSRLDADEVAWLGLQLASALRYLHRRGLLHLDVKPSNIIASAGRAVLIDLSLAREPGRYRAGLGTWCHLSPEQARGDRLTAAADVWGLGTVLYEAATGEPAFEDDASVASTSDTWQTEEQLDAGFPQLEAPAPKATGPLAAVIDACLAFDPTDRPTLPELAAELRPHAPGAHPWSD
jgi:eukaryotic-like serine/threonine-protein kinase